MSNIYDRAFWEKTDFHKIVQSQMFDRILALSAPNPTKSSNTPKQFVDSLSAFDHFVGLALGRLKKPLQKYMFNLLVLTQIENR